MGEKIKENVQEKIGFDFKEYSEVLESVTDEVSYTIGDNVVIHFKGIKDPLVKSVINVVQIIITNLSKEPEGCDILKSVNEKLGSFFSIKYKHVKPH